MGCTEVGHHHVWGTKGSLVIQQCETRCNFCTGEKSKKPWKYAWFLRRHVRNVHCNRKKGDYPNVVVSHGWKATKGSIPPPHPTQIKTRASEQPDTKVGLSGQKPLPDFDWIPPPKIEGADNEVMPPFDEEQARAFNLDNVVHDVLNNPNLLLGNEEVDTDNPMLALFDNTDPQAFMKHIMRGCTHQTTEIIKSTSQRKQPADADQPADAGSLVNGNGAHDDEDPEPKFEGYNGLPDEAIDELAGEFGVAGIDSKTSNHVRGGKGKARMVDGDGTQINGEEIRRSVAYVPTTPLPERNSDSPVEITGTPFDWSPDDVPDQFFMSDYSTPSSHSDLDDRPLAEYFNATFPSGPGENQLNMMGMLHTTSEEMRAQGMENKEMLWTMGQFARSLAEFGNPTLATGLVLQHTPYEPFPLDEPFPPFQQQGDMVELD